MSNAAAQTDTGKSKPARSPRRRAQTIAARKTQPLDLAELTGHTGYLLRRAQLAVFSDIINAHATRNIRPAEFSVLMLVENNPGAIHADIADALGIKRANFVTLFNGLEKRGLVERRQGQGDKRAQALFLTVQGVAMLEELRALARAHEQRIIARLGAREHADLLTKLAVLTDLADV